MDVISIPSGNRTILREAIRGLIEAPLVLHPPVLDLVRR
jgi:hypothetical protein